MEYAFHKDRTPGETISLTRSILTEIGFSLVESHHFFCEGCYSVRVKDERFPYLGTNGKGTTRERALASAYAEFMERLQNRFLLQSRFGLMKLGEEYPDQENITLDELIKQGNCPGLFKNFSDSDFKARVGERVKTLRCLPFYRVDDGKIVYLPANLISAYCFSTGLCAGNTPQEAFVQGICEIFERSAVRRVYESGMILPTIPLSRIKHLKVAALAEGFIAKGYRLIVKDFTLGGAFPVLGIILVAKNQARYKLRIGSDPVFEVALLRCFNEIVQGYESENFQKSLLPLQWSTGSIGSLDGSDKKRAARDKGDFVQFIINGLARYNDCVFYTGGAPSLGDAFVPAFTGQEDLLNHVVNLARRKGFSIYVRDVSFLGFPSYQVYIPGMSEMVSFTKEEEWFLLCEEPEFRGVMLRLKEAAPGGLRKLADYMEYKLTMPFNSHDEYYSSIADIFLEERSDLFSLPPRSLLALIYLRLQDYEKAFAHLDECRVREESGADPEGQNTRRNEVLNMVYSCLLFCLKLKLEGVSHPAIRENLLQLYDEEAVSQVMAYLDEPERVFDYYTLPQCGDCSFCPVRGECYYPQWERLEINILKRQKSNPIKQEKLAEFFSFTG